ncbi:MAG: acetolactate synthase 2 small subunit [Shewanella sp.]|nr:acetolactate synthase 2 small subunit [Shewanella sp.]MCF1430381.1 acetolactate synthase 2 small subunit [Shewanella sp.]MCF1438873.1 acetolactate synthase 2 small subunit [Shewanella sp.]MCF1457138.1 acetolactate synthase 2 small subunit [Shewanella sp.]
MKHSLELQVSRRPEVLERVLRVVRHRGFRVTHMQMREQGDSSLLAMTVEAERAIELLSNQLIKLVDVNLCTVLSEQAARQARV